MADAALQARRISKRFGDLVAVDGVDLDLRQGEIHAVIGPNGAGKSTLLAVLAGELAPETGAVWLHTSDVTRTSVERRARHGIGRTFQRSSVIPHMTALDMVRLAALRHETVFHWLSPLVGLPDATGRARDALARVGLSHRAESVAATLSHGDQRRLEIAAVLALQPGVLLLDEPLAGLGRDGAREVVALIETLRSSCAIMLIEHDMDVVFAIADRITVLQAGRVIASGDPTAVRANSAVQSAYLGSEIQQPSS